MQIKRVLFCYLQDFADVISGELVSKAESEIHKKNDIRKCVCHFLQKNV